MDWRSGLVTVDMPCLPAGCAVLQTALSLLPHVRRGPHIHMLYVQVY